MRVRTGQTTNQIRVSPSKLPSLEHRPKTERDEKAGEDTLVETLSDEIANELRRGNVCTLRLARAHLRLGHEPDIE
jgi:hypothetical protein